MQFASFDLSGLLQDDCLIATLFQSLLRLDPDGVILHGVTLVFVKHAHASPLYSDVASRLRTSVLNPRWDHEWGVETFDILMLRWELLPLDLTSQPATVSSLMLPAEVARTLSEHHPSLGFFSPFQGSENDLGLLWALTRADNHGTLLTIGTASFDIGDDFFEEQLRASLSYLASMADTAGAEALFLGCTGSYHRNNFVQALGWSTSGGSKAGSNEACAYWRPRRLRLNSSEGLSLRCSRTRSSSATPTKEPCQVKGLLVQFTLATHTSSGVDIAGSSRQTTMVSPVPGQSSGGSGDRDFAISPPSSTAPSGSGLLTPAQELARTPLQPGAFSAITPDPALYGWGNSSGDGITHSHNPSAHLEGSRSPPPLRQRIKRKRGPNRENSAADEETSALSAPLADSSRSCRIVRPRPNPAPDDSFTESKTGAMPTHGLFVGMGRDLAHRGGTDDSDDEDDDDEADADHEWHTCRSLPSTSQQPGLARLPYRLTAFAEEPGGGRNCGQEFAPGASLSPPPLPRASNPQATSLHSSTAAAAALAAATVASAISLASPIASQRQTNKSGAE